MRYLKEMRGVSVLLIILFCAIFSSSSVCSSEDTFPLKIPRSIYYEKEDIRQGELHESHQAILGVMLDKDSMLSVISKIGDTKFHKPTVKHGIDLLCYVSSQENDDTVIYYGAENNEVITFSLSAQLTDYYRFEECAKNDHVNKDISTIGGIKLGLSRDEYKALLGTPTLEELIEEDTYFIFYTFQSRVRLSQKTLEWIVQHNPAYKDDPYMTHIWSVKAIFKNDQLVFVSIYVMDDV